MSKDRRHTLSEPQFFVAVVALVLLAVKFAFWLDQYLAR